MRFGGLNNRESKEIFFQIVQLAGVGTAVARAESTIWSNNKRGAGRNDRQEIQLGWNREWNTKSVDK